VRCLGEEVERLDAELASLARVEGGLRLRLGQVLEVLSRGGHFDLGFSSMRAYALERCDRSARWAEAARCLARRVEPLPELRRALAVREVSWSMGELLGRVAQPEDEGRWLEAAKSRTVRQMRVVVMQAISDAREVGRNEEHAAARVTAPTLSDGLIEGASNGVSEGGSNRVRGGARNSDVEEGEEMCTLTCTVDQEDAWLYEATRALLGQLGTHGGDAQCEALLAEGLGTLLAALPEGALDAGGWECKDDGQRRWLDELERWRTEAEARCEAHFMDCVLGSREAACHRGPVASAAACGLASLENVKPEELDAGVRGLASALAGHELELSRLLLRFHRADGWRRCGYATESQYARERLGMSRSSLLAKRALAVGLEKLPHVAEALGAGRIGVEAAVQLVRVATPNTEAAWVARARQRTIKHLREEVAAAQVALRISGESACLPPEDAELSAFHELERAVVRGHACQPRAASNSDVTRAVGEARGLSNGSIAAKGEPTSEPRRAWLVMLASLADWLDCNLQAAVQTELQTDVQTSAQARAPRSRAGRVVLRWHVSRATHAAWRGLEAQARRWLPCGMSWLRFLCLSLWQAWRHLLGQKRAYGQIYIRDRYRCVSPVCSRRDVTPHHLQFRSAGGSDHPANIGSVCTWCHLRGIHGGRIRPWGTAEHIHWELGTPGSPCLIVHGRQREAA
jgi:hypothetical protein